MNELIRQIEEIVLELVRYDLDGYAAHVQGLVNSMVAVFPEIIAYYGDPRMTDVRDNALYWPGQLERIIKALESPDRFEAVDVLYNETYQNLVELRDMLAKRGLL